MLINLAYHIKRQEIAERHELLVFLEVEEPVVVLVNDPVDVADLLLEIIRRVNGVSNLSESKKSSPRTI